MKRIIIGLALLCLGATTPVAAAVVHVQLLAINDFHGRLEPPEGADGMVGGVQAGGVEYLATHLNAAAKTNPNTLIVAAGDLAGASPLLSAMFDDAPTHEAMDALGMQISALGNHELDHGGAEFLTRVAAGKVQYLAANVQSTDPPGAPFLPPTKVVTIGGVKVGFIGEILHGAPSILAPHSGDGLAFFDEADAANAAAEVLQRQGVKAIVLLIHEGGGQNPAKGAVQPNSCDGFKGDIMPILNRLTPAIKVVVSGHTHNMYNCVIAGRRVTSAGAYGRLYTALTLSIDARSDRIVAVKAANHIVTRDVAKDPAQTAIIEKYRPRAAVLAQRPVGSVTAPIATQPNSAGESPLGDVVADSHLASARGGWAPTAQIAFTNSGGLRAQVGDAPGATVSFQQLYAAQPFGNQLVALTLTGDALVRLLEHQFSADGQRGILQVSKGFTYRYRQDAPQGHHIEPGSVKIDGRVVEPTEAIRVVLSDFLYAGGDGSSFSEGRDVVSGVSDIDAIVHYFTANSPVAPGPQDRIVRTDPPS